MSSLKPLACSILTLLCLGAVLTMTSAKAAPLPVVIPPVQKVSVSREAPFTDLKDLRNDFGVSSLTADVSEFLQSQTSPVALRDLADGMRAMNWKVTSVDPDEVRYIYVIDPNGDVQEICLAGGGLLIDDGSRSQLAITLEIVQEL